MQHRRNPLVLAAAAAVLTVSGASAGLATPQQKQVAAVSSLKQAVTQVDGMTARALDKVWAQTDAYWHEGDYNRVVTLLRVMAEAEPAEADTYSNAAWLLWSMGDMAGANAFLKYGVARSPDKGEIQFEFGNHLYLNAKDYKAALPYLKAATSDPRAPVAAWTALGHCYEKMGNLPASLAAWRVVEKKYPQFPAGKPNRMRVEAKIKGTP